MCALAANGTRWPRPRRTRSGQSPVGTGRSPDCCCRWHHYHHHHQHSLLRPSWAREQVFLGRLITDKIQKGARRTRPEKYRHSTTIISLTHTRGNAAHTELTEECRGAGRTTTRYRCYPSNECFSQRLKYSCHRAHPLPPKSPPSCDTP